jgi:tRNA 2-thiouridine synthesizing protein A
MRLGCSSTLLDLHGLHCPLPVVRTRKMPRRLGAARPSNRRMHRSARPHRYPRLPRETGDKLEREHAANDQVIFQYEKRI